MYCPFSYPVSEQGAGLMHDKHVYAVDVISVLVQKVGGI